MPRKQLDILKDLCLAHRDGDAAGYRKAAGEFVRYLTWKGFHHKAREFEAIFENPPAVPTVAAVDASPVQPGHQMVGLNDQGRSSALVDRAESESQPSLFAAEAQTVLPATAAAPAWQVSQGADINFLKAQRLLETLRQHPHKRYTSKEFGDILGYAEKKAQGFARQLTYLGLLEDKTRQSTPLACVIQQYDPYFEDTGTLWLLHYIISSQPHLVIWNRLVNHLFATAQFGLDDARPLFEDQRATHSETSFKTHLRKESMVCVRAYLESEFSHLHLLASEDDETYSRLAPALIPDPVLLAAILVYRARFYANSVALEVNTLIAPENAPGRLCFLHEAHLREALERLRLTGDITIESFADLDQIKFTRATEPVACLEHYYQEKFGNCHDRQS